MMIPVGRQGLKNKTLLLGLALISVAAAADKGPPKFSPGAALSYPSRQTSNKVTIAAVPYDSEDQTRGAFGKLNPNKYGVLPLLVVIQNDSHQSLRLDGIRVEYVAPDRSHVEATPARDVPYLSGPSQPKFETGPIPKGNPRVKRKKNPLAGGEIDVRAFSARMLPPGEQASGFFYFQASYRKGSQAYVTGIQEAGSGKELFYFEIPLSDSGTQGVQ